MSRTFILVLALATLAGCTAIPGDPGGDEIAALSSPQDPVVIALIDTGTSPYYPLFQVADDTEVMRAVPIPTTRVEFTLPSGGDPVDRDRALWESLEPGILYHFGGTRLFGISFDGPDRQFHYVRDADFHGVATSYLAAREAPGAVIVMVQMRNGLCMQDASCLVSPTIADAMEWVAEQDWIDIVSVSLALPANMPDRPEIHDEVGRYLRASEAAAASGKLIVNGAGNQPSSPVTDYFNGPPWVIAVGGADFNASGESVLAAKTVDVVSNFTDYVPRYGIGDLEWRSGTSFATPIVSGTLADALARIRTADPSRGTISQELRDAMNVSAIYFETSEWDPMPPGRQPIQDELLAATLPVMVQAQMGWGYVDSRLSTEVARRVLESDIAFDGKEQAAAFQPAWQSAREEFWNAYGS